MGAYPIPLVVFLVGLVVCFGLGFNAGFRP